MVAASGLAPPIPMLGLSASPTLRRQRVRPGRCDKPLGHPVIDVVETGRELAFEELKRPDRRSLAYIDEALDVEETIAERVGNLPPEEFFDLLHPIIAEDEWKLLAVGAILGLGAGWWQWALLT